MENAQTLMNSYVGPSPYYPKTHEEWVLSSALYDGIEEKDVR